MGSTYEFGAQNVPQLLTAALYCSLVNSFYVPFRFSLNAHSNFGPKLIHAFAIFVRFLRHDKTNIKNLFIYFKRRFSKMARWWNLKKEFTYSDVSCGIS